MKTLCVLLLAVFACANSAKLIGSKKCTWGPSYWCESLRSAAGCGAVKHCTQTIWQQHVYPEDNDSICETCKSMVKQARDQLESNETQEEIKEVFEGSCKLIPIKIVAGECCKLADDFIPELIDTLASQMNPNTVCTVAGLCNNANIDKLLEEQAKQEVVTKHPPVEMDTCTGCHKVVDLVESKFNDMSRDEFLETLLQVCANMGSFSDACSNIIITNFNEIYLRMKRDFSSTNICLMSGECSTNFHVHSVEVTPNSNVGVVPVNDDLPCELCEQLVGHLRDLLVADTTEAEFEKVLEGICKQTGSFAKQCGSIVSEYYPVIYKFLTTALNSTEICTYIQICPNPNKKVIHPIMPLLPVESAPKAKLLMQKGDVARIGVSQDSSNIKVIKPVGDFEAQTPEMMQLPIERLNSPFLNHFYNKEVCTFCEYFLHYIQQAITNPATEKSVKETVEKACNFLPNSVNETCVQFVDDYGDAVIALLVQEIDPSTICPLIRVCPGQESHDIEIFMQVSKDDKPNCPLCLFAVTKLEEMIKDDKSKTNIKKALGNLCSYLSNNLAEECEDFVTAYTDELVEMLVDDFKPQEVCVYLKICTDNKPAPAHTDLNLGGLTLTNEIPDFTINGQMVGGPVKQTVKDKPQCVICEFVMEKLQDELKDKKNEDEIKHIVHNICHAMPKTVTKQCDDFVDKYADLVIALLVSEASPSEICTELKLCEPKKSVVELPKNVGSPQCVMCKMVMTQIESLLAGKVDEADVQKALDAVCEVTWGDGKKNCLDFMEKNGDTIYKFLMMAVAPGEICSLIFLCESKQPQKIMADINTCAVCETAVIAIDKILQNPKVDHSIEHVLEKACRALPEKQVKKCRDLVDNYGQSMISYVTHLSDPAMVCKEVKLCHGAARPRREVKAVGANECTYGPTHWCSSDEIATKCKVVKYCEEWRKNQANNNS